jgi:PEP-CTERM motif
MRNLIFYLVVPAIVAAPLVVGSRSQAQALTTFASVDTTTNQTLTFINAGTLSTFGTTSVSVPVVFTYKIVNDYGGINVSIPSTMTITSSVTGGAGGYNQQINSIQMSITANTPVNGKTNLLRLVNSTGRLADPFLGGSGAANFLGSTSSGSIVGFSSDFLDFSNTTARAFNFALNSVTPTTNLNGNGYMDTFISSGIGNFASNPAPLATVPEPGTLGLLALTALPMLGLLRRRKL